MKESHPWAVSGRGGGGGGRWGGGGGGECGRGTRKDGGGGKRGRREGGRRKKGTLRKESRREGGKKGGREGEREGEMERLESCGSYLCTAHRLHIPGTRGQRSRRNLLPLVTQGPCRKEMGWREEEGEMEGHHPHPSSAGRVWGEGGRVGGWSVMSGE